MRKRAGGYPLSTILFHCPHHDGARWTGCSALVLAALDKALQLARETQELVTSFALVPTVRTSYQRTAFQLSSSNAVRISIDSELQFLNERMPKRRRHCFVDPEDASGPRDAFFFEYAILEIKLQEAPPAWIDELLASGILLPVYKFSKFLSGALA